MSSSSNYDQSSKHNLLGFVPAIVIDNLLEKIRKKELRKIPERQTFSSVVMFADISGFTNLSEKLSEKGAEGAELLAFALTRYMEFLVKSIGKSGGDIFKFAGDAMIVIWPPPQHNTDEELTTLCRQAIQSSLDIQSKLHEIRLVDDIKLSVKIGFGVGQVTILHVGGVFSRAEYLAAGDPLKEAFECEHLAPGGGVIIVSRNVYQRVQNYFEFEQIVLTDASHAESAPFFYIRKCKKDQAVKMKADALLLNTRIKPSDIEAIKSSLMSYIPAAVLPFIELNEEKWSHELRHLSVMFCNLGIDLNDAQSLKGLERIQLVIETIQKCVYKYQGSLNKLLLDDKGSTLMIIFGLYPMAHQDDPVRAVLTGLSLIKELRKINCSCSVGITTGVVFAGVVGTSGSRREFSVLGDVVNLSARFMQAAIKQKDKKILVDIKTKLEAQNKISFKFAFNDQVKGKTGNIPFYEPVDVDDEEIKVFPYNLRTHIHTPQKGENVGSESFDMSGKLRDENFKKIVQFFEKFQKKPDHNFLILLTGTYGIGKSLFLRNFVEKSMKITESTSWKYGESSHILIHTLNPSTKGDFLNGWRVVFQKILNLFTLRLKILPETLMITILEDDQDLLKNMHLVSDVLNLKLNTRRSVHDSMDPNRFSDKNIKMIKKILLKLLHKFLEEDMTDSSLRVNGQKKELSKQDIAPPLVIVLDDMQDYDTNSWSFTKKVLKHIKKIFIIGAVRNKLCEIPPSFLKKKTDGKDNSTEEILEGLMFDIEEAMEPAGFFKFELIGLETEEILNLTRKTMGSDGIKLEEIKETIKEPTKENLKKSRDNTMTSSKKENKPQEMNEDIISAKTLKIFVLKSEGNPCDALQILSNLTSNGYISVKDHKMVITKKLLKCLQMNQFLTVEPPLSRTIINGEVLDRLDSQSYLLMKAAAVIGDCFDLQMLIKVNPFTLSLTNDKVKKLIVSLEKQELIEILDEKDHNIIYRFVHPFMREVIYSRMIFSQRRQIHRYVAEAIQSNPLQNESNEAEQSNSLIYHWCLAERLDPLLIDLENSQFSNKAKRSLIVKKISSLFSKNQANSNIVVKSGNLEKKSDRGLSWSNRFLVLTCRDLKYYYTEADFKENTDFALGVISLKHIFKIYHLDERESKKPYAFVIFTGSWTKKNKEMGIREFYFSSDTFANLETWTTYIEFLRAKAIYDDFVHSFGRISFPLAANDKGENLEGGSKLNMVRTKLQSYEKTRTSYHSSSNQRKNTTRKTTLLKGTKGFGIALNSIQDVITTNTTQENAKKLKDRIFRFFTAGLLTFFSHITQNAAQKCFKDAEVLEFGQTTTILRKFPIHFDPTLFEDIKNKQNNLLSSEYLDDNQSRSKRSISLPPEDDSQDRDDTSSNSKQSTNKKKSLGEDPQFGELGVSKSLFLNDTIPSTILINKSRSNLEMIKEVEERHSLTNSLAEDKEKDKDKENNKEKPFVRNSERSNTIGAKTAKPSHFLQKTEIFKEENEIKKIEIPKKEENKINENANPLLYHKFSAEGEDVSPITPIEDENYIIFQAPSKSSRELTKQDIENLKFPYDPKRKSSSKFSDNTTIKLTDEKTDKTAERISFTSEEYVKPINFNNIPGWGQAKTMKEEPEGDSFVSESVFKSKKNQLKRNEDSPEFISNYGDIQLDNKNNIIGVIQRNDFPKAVSLNPIDLKNLKDNKNDNIIEKGNNQKDKKNENIEKIDRKKSLIKNTVNYNNEEKNNNNNNNSFITFEDNKKNFNKEPDENYTFNSQNSFDKINITNNNNNTIINYDKINNRGIPKVLQRKKFKNENVEKLEKGDFLNKLPFSQFANERKEINMNKDEENSNFNYKKIKFYPKTKE